MWSFHNWVRAALRDNKPIDEFVREIITAEGSTYTDGPANYYRIGNNPADWAETTAQIFLGVRMQCARCHHHPFEKWTQERLLRHVGLLRSARHEARAGLRIVRR